MTYQPRGSMCMACQHAKSDCSGLPFDQMQVIDHLGKTRIVACASFQRRDDNQ